MIGKHMLEKYENVPQQIENFEKSMVYYELYNNELFNLLKKYPKLYPHEIKKGKEEIGDLIDKIQSQKSTLDSQWSELDKSLSKYDNALSKFAMKRSIPINNNEEPIIGKTYLSYHPIDSESIKNELIDNIMEMEFTFIDLEWAEVRSKGFQKDMFGCLCNLESASIKDDLDVLSVIDENQEMTNNLIGELKNCLDKLMIYNKNLELLKNAK